MFMDFDRKSAHKHAKKKTFGEDPAIWPQAWSVMNINKLVLSQNKTIVCAVQIQVIFKLKRIFAC